jgi:hypothetical protein
MTHTYRGKRCHTRPRCSLKVHNRSSSKYLISATGSDMLFRCRQRVDLPDTTKFSLIVSAENANEFCAESRCLDDLEVPIARNMADGFYLVQVVGVDGVVRDESRPVQVYPIDAIPAPTDVAICALDAQAAPCNGVIATQLPKTLRLTFKNPAIDDEDPARLPTYFYCEFSTNLSSFDSAVVISTTFPYEHLRTSPYQHSIPIPDLLVGLVLFVRLRLPNNVASGYFGTASTGVAALRPPSAPSIVGLGSGVDATDGSTLLLQVRRPTDLGDGGHETARAVVFQIFIATSVDAFASGSNPPSTLFSTNPRTEVTNVTISQSSFNGESRTQVESILRVRQTVFVWARANNLNIENMPFSSSISEARTIQVTSTPGSMSMVNLSRIGHLAAKLAWTPPEDRGLGDSFDYPISYQYAEIASDTSTISVLHDVVTVEYNVQHVNLTGLQKGKLYFFSVRAVNDVGFGPWFNAGDCASYPPDIFPATCGLLAMSFPEVLVIPNLTQGNGSLVAAWQYPSDPGTGASGPRVTLKYEIELQDMRDIAVESTEIFVVTTQSWIVFDSQAAGPTLLIHVAVLFCFFACSQCC